MAVALIVAAGRGERLGLGRPKALVMVAGRPMLQWSVDAVRSVPGVERIAVALPSEAMVAAPEGCVAVAGGAVRSESVRVALAAMPAGDPVIVHDAARPLATPQLFAAALAELTATEADAVIVAAPVTDTVKQVAPAGVREVERTLDRARLWAVQTPQVFRRQALEEALLGASDELLGRATDDAWLIEQAGGRVVVLPVTGFGENLKVTTPLDLRVAELILADRRGSARDDLTGGSAGAESPGVHVS